MKNFVTSFLQVKILPRNHPRKPRKQKNQNLHDSFLISSLFKILPQGHGWEINCFIKGLAEEQNKKKNIHFSGTTRIQFGKFLMQACLCSFKFVESIWGQGRRCTYCIIIINILLVNIIFTRSRGFFCFSKVGMGKYSQRSWLHLEIIGPKEREMKKTFWVLLLKPQICPPRPTFILAYIHMRTQWHTHRHRWPSGLACWSHAARRFSSANHINEILHFL